jgi:hypothetical protein
MDDKKGSRMCSNRCTHVFVLGVKVEVRQTLPLMDDNASSHLTILVTDGLVKNIKLALNKRFKKAYSQKLVPCYIQF